VANHSKACSDCGTTDSSLHYLSGKMARCYDCQRFYNLSKKATGGGVHFTRVEYLEWVRADPDRRRCSYCGLDRDHLYELRIINPRNKKPFESIGVDRRDNDGPYELDNLVPCCGPCNAIRSSILSHDEMAMLGPHLRTIWAARAAAAAQAPPQP